MVVLGLDIGKKRIGVALWSPKSRIVTPVTVIQVTKPIAAFREIEALTNTHTPDKMVLGYPLMPNGKPGELAKARGHLGGRLGAQLCADRAVGRTHYQQTGGAGFKEPGLAQKEQFVVDMAAAMRILESYDEQRSPLMKSHLRLLFGCLALMTAR